MLTQFPVLLDRKYKIQWESMLPWFLLYILTIEQYKKNTTLEIIIAKGKMIKINGQKTLEFDERLKKIDIEISYIGRTHECQLHLMQQLFD